MARNQSSKQDKDKGKAQDRNQAKVRYAMVGLGHIAQVAAMPGFATAKKSELAALVTGDPEKQKKLGRKYGVERIYSYDEFDECLESGIDAVYIALPNHLHREYTVRAADAGIHVLCEKPMAPSEQECREMIEAAERNRVKLMIAYRLHFEKANLEAIHLAQSGKLGDLRIFSSDFAQQVVKDNIRVTESTERGGGPVYDMGVYCINAARYLFRDEPEEVFASSANDGEARFRKTDEMTSVIMRFPQERLATFTCSFGAADISRYTLIGAKGVLALDPAYEYKSDIEMQLTIDGKTRTRKFPKRDQFAAEIEYFSQCILEDTAPEPSGEEGLADVRIVNAIHQSARSGKPVQLPPSEKRRRPGLRQQIHRPAHGKPKTVKTQSPSGEAA
jgi:predicted dehydrogenase